MKRAESAFLGPVQSLDQFLDRPLIVLAALLQAGDPPQVDVFLAGRPQPFLKTLLQFLEGSPFGKADFGVSPGITQKHLVAASLERFAVGNDFVAPAGIDVVDAAVNAAADDFAAILIELGVAGAYVEPTLAVGFLGQHLIDSLPMPAQTDGGDHHVGLAAAAVFHVRVVAGNLARILVGRVAGVHRLGCGEAQGDTRRGQGAVAHECSTRQLGLVCHLGSSLRESSVRIAKSPGVAQRYASPSVQIVGRLSRRSSLRQNS